jgi:apolipoprotein N-acyltransferase
MRLGQTDVKGGPTVCLLQSNLDQRLRESALAAEGDERTAEERISQHFAALSLRATQTRPDLVIWPETSFPRPWVHVSPDLPIEKTPMEWRNAEAAIRDGLKDFALKFERAQRVPHLLGMNTHYLDEHGKHVRFNSAVLLSAQGNVVGQFNKMHRVPFGEFVPFKDWLPFLAWLTPYEGDFGIKSGEKFTRFEVGKYRFGVLVCFEDTDPCLARRYLENSDDGEPVDFLVNISNDGWFDGSNEHEAHLAVSRFRAIECRRSMVRAVNMGVSAVIDSNGRVLKPREVPGMEPPVWRVTEEQTGYAELPASEWHEFKKKPGILRAVVPIDRRFSFYVVAGDWLPIGCWAILLAGAGWSYWRRRSAAKAAGAT